MNMTIKAVASAGILAGGLFATPALASPTQEPRGAAKPEGASQAGGVEVRFETDYAKDYGTAVVAQGDAEESARKYVSGRGWQVGRNGSPETGFLVVIGTGPVVAGDPNSFDQRRRQAAKEAMLQAKKQMVQYLAAKIETDTKFRYVEGTPPLDEISAATAVTSKQPGAVAKLKAILDHEIDKQLKARNIDPSLKTPEERAKAEAEAKQAAREILGDTKFRDAVKIVAEHELSGLQAFRTFESVGSGGTGKIAVVSVYSKKSADLQKALLGLGPAPSGMPQQSIASWCESQGADVLLYTHGVQVRTNERGEVVLVAFGQSSPLGNKSGSVSQSALSAAEAKARNQAMSELRRFMGELVATAESDMEASTYTDFADGTSEFKSQSRYEAELNARAESLDMPGILPATWTWTKQHPQSNRPTKGCVVVWAVSESLEANGLRDRLKAAGGASGGTGISDKRPSKTATDVPKVPAAGQSSGGSGAEGEQP